MPLKSGHYHLGLEEISGFSQPNNASPVKDSFTPILTQFDRSGIFLARPYPFYDTAI